LPSKNTAERLDFTRQWVKNDIRAWVDKPSAKDRILTSPDQQVTINLSKTNLFKHFQLLTRQHSSGADSDEHSLGSCSAEVAAINIKTPSTKQQKQHEPKQAPIKK
jgi:hypothetical protein